MDQTGKLSPHIQLKPNHEYGRVLTCGAPERAEVISRYLDGARCIAKNREYHSYLGTFAGKSILVTSHGVGAAGAAICFQELIDVGARAIVRVGTAGGLFAGAEIGDIVIATAAIRADGVTRLMVPEGFPAVADLHLTQKISEALESSQVRHQRGIVLTSDLFYPGLLDDLFNFYHRAHAKAVEMECAALFVIGSLRQVQTGAVLVLDGDQLRFDEGHYDPTPIRLKSPVESCALAALNALVRTHIE